MKKFIFFLSVCLGFLSSCSKDDNVDSEKNISKNRVITIMEYEWRFGEKSTYGDVYEKFVYNVDNKLISKETNYKNAMVGRIPCYYTYTYDNKGHLIGSTETGLSSYIYKYTFNSIDSIETMLKYGKDGKLDEAWTYTYDSHKRLIQAKQTYGVLIPYVDDYSYSENNVKVVRHRVDNGELFGTTLYVYDEHKNLTKEIWINGDTGKEDLSTFNEYTYNAQGKVQRKTIHQYLFPENVTYNDYTYNSDGSIKSVHVSYSWKDDQSDLDYSYTIE